MSGAISRTVQPGIPMGLAPRGALAACPALNFPNKNPGEILDYVVDFSLEMQGGTDTVIQSYTIVISPAGQLLAINAETNDLTVGFDLKGGVAGTNYEITVTATFPSGLVAQAFVGIFVNPVPSPSQAPGEVGSTDFSVLANSQYLGAI